MSKFRQEQLRQPLNLSGSFTGSLLGTASFAEYAGNISPTDLSGYVSYSIFNPFTASIGRQISTGSVTASVDINPNELFLIKSGSNIYFNISASSNTELYSDLFIIKNFTTQQPVLIISQSIVQFVTQSTDPIGTTNAGSIWFTPTTFYVGLEDN
jgi:hypothetical protein